MSKLGNLQFQRIDTTYQEDFNHLMCTVNVLVLESTDKRIDVTDIDPRDILDYANLHRQGIEERTNIEVSKRAKQRSFSIHWSLGLLQSI